MSQNFIGTAVTLYLCAVRRRTRLSVVTLILPRWRDASTMLGSRHVKYKLLEPIHRVIPMLL
jgi:hypothetical protein